MTHPKTALGQTSQSEGQHLLVSLAIQWERAALNGKMDMEAITQLLDNTSAHIGRDWARNLAQGFTASALEQTLNVLLPIIVDTDHHLVGKNKDETIDQWFTRLEHSGPEAVYDFLDRLRPLIPRAYRPGDHGHQMALMIALVNQVDKHGLSAAAAMTASHRAIKKPGSPAGQTKLAGATK
ncbi:hypothetical protein EZI54_07360 [Marinobacter halodurans]|uniref:DUF1641 domain-containing protein n=1 Tax=Marinobacter halodurans TaxID=2528979 RepID=A0ABY1ZME2_9GAMM|nr:hypothetical protein [Marinobacter halodurans]TBW57469.1 hypothetical protein EZI54_07360 [Marinobacter halodurans]